MDLFKTWLVEDYIAHRGLHNEIYPENSLGAFKNAVDYSFPIELDVHMIADGTLVVFHDDSLSRVTGKDGYITHLTKKDLQKYKLCNTDYTIPTLDEVLEVVDGKVPLLIEIKNADKVGNLESKLYHRLKEYKGEFAIESFNPFVIKWFKDNAPEILRGILSGYLKNSNLKYYKKFALKHMLLNKVCQPHFIAYEAKTLPNRFVKKYKQLPLLAWTVKSQEEYLKVVKYCDNIIFEGFEPKI